MSDILTTVEWTNVATATNVQLVSDTTDPAGPGPIAGTHLLAPLQVGWGIDDILPPVAKPATASVSYYDAGPVFKPIDIGDPIAVYVNADGVDVVLLQGRVADNSAVNHPAGGVVVTVIVADRIADLTSNLAVSSVSGLGVGNSALFDYYQGLVDGEDGELDFDWTAGDSFAFPFWFEDGAISVDLTNVSLYDAMTRFIIQDIRSDDYPGSTDPLDYISRFLVIDVDETDPSPPAVAPYRLQEWNATMDLLAGTLEIILDAGVYVLGVNEDYYLGGGQGMVLSADQMLSDVGEWRKTRQAAINRIELQGEFNNGSVTATVRRSFADLVDAYGANTRTLPCDCVFRDPARVIGDVLLGPRDQVQRGWGLQTATLIWDRMTAAQLAADWPAYLWPAFRPGSSAGGTYAYPLAIVDVPDDWRLADSVAVVGRLMGVAWVVAGTDARAQLTIRGTPPSGRTGVDWAHLPALMTYANIDPEITYEQLTLVED